MCKKSKNFGNTNFMDTRSNPNNMTSQDNSEKCLSITDDRIDSGIASMTLSDIEKQRNIDEKLEDTPRYDSALGYDSFSSERLYSEPLDSGLGGTSAMCQDNGSRKLDVTDKIAMKIEQERLESDPGFQSFTKSDEFYEPFLPHIEGLSPLHVAILDGNVTRAMDMIESSPEPTCLDFFTPEIHTALHLAVYANLPEIVRFLIVYGANFNSRDQRGNTPLHTACEFGRTSCVKMILSPLDEVENIGIQKSRIPQDINDKNYEGLTPLHLATINNQWQVVSFLAQQPDINVNIGDSTSGRTALHHALERRHTQCFFQLLQSSVNVNATTYDGCSPLHVAVGLELEQETRFLMTRGADIAIETSDDIRAWDLARTEKIKDALQYSMLQMQNTAVRQR